eukprot:CAMPEP_0170742184 /NCGR_PEP_ID=MMETSP0437-20130122/6613_1 /TAXON_ID=0 /ORGANISM="Sexangularia sp." /LENGTH=707 /DNA_ID=CAMNT_0011080797 /DNA_START=28 /DNA_END=2147 /DNA_ORIENTATION=+
MSWHSLSTAIARNDLEQVKKISLKLCSSSTPPPAAACQAHASALYRTGDKGALRSFLKSPLSASLATNNRTLFDAASRADEEAQVAAREAEERWRRNGDETAALSASLLRANLNRHTAPPTHWSTILALLPHRESQLVAKARTNLLLASPLTSPTAAALARAGADGEPKFSRAAARVFLATGDTLLAEETLQHAADTAEVGDDVFEGRAVAVDRAVLALRRGRLDEATALLNSARRVGDESPLGAVIENNIVATRRGKEELFDCQRRLRVARARGAPVAADYNWGVFLIHQGKLAQALELATSLDDRAPTHAAVLRASVELRRGQRAAAVATLTNARAAASSTSTDLVWLSAALAQLSLDAGARADAIAALEAVPNRHAYPGLVAALVELHGPATETGRQLVAAHAHAIRSGATMLAPADAAPATPGASTPVAAAPSTPVRKTKTKRKKGGASAAATPASPASPAVAAASPAPVSRGGSASGPLASEALVQVAEHLLRVEEREAAIRVLGDALALQPDNFRAAVLLVSADASRAAELQAQLPPMVSKVSPTFDVNAAIASSSRTAPTLAAATAAAAGDGEAVADAAAALAARTEARRARRKAKRKPRYPKGFDPEHPERTPPVDPLRWLPKAERLAAVSGKRGGGKGRRGGSNAPAAPKGHQGVASEDTVAYNVEVVAAKAAAKKAKAAAVASAKAPAKAPAPSTGG